MVIDGVIVSNAGILFDLNDIFVRLSVLLVVGLAIVVLVGFVAVVLDESESTSSS